MVERIEIRKQGNAYKFQFKVKKVPIFYLFTLMLFSVVGFIAPVFMVTLSDKLGFGFIISFVVFWGVAFFLLRLLIWNLFGKEFFSFKGDVLTYYSDYKFFKSEEKRISTKGMKVSATNHASNKRIYCLNEVNIDDGELFFLNIENDNDCLRSNILLTGNELKAVFLEMNQLLN